MNKMHCCYMIPIYGNSSVYKNCGNNPIQFIMYKIDNTAFFNILCSEHIRKPYENFSVYGTIISREKYMKLILLS